MKKLFFKFFSSSICSILALILLGAPPVFAKETQKKLRILALGDSLTAGYRLDQKKGFPYQLQKLFVKAGKPVEVINAGVSGDTAQQGLQRIDWVLGRSGPFDIMLLELGANDGLRQNSVAAMKNSLEKIIEKARSKNIQVFLLGMKLPTNFNKKYRNEFEASYPKLAKKHKIPLLPFILEGVAQKDEYNLSDLLHPNEAGHAIIAKNLFDWLNTLPSFSALLP